MKPLFAFVMSVLPVTPANPHRQFSPRCLGSFRWRFLVACLAGLASTALAADKHCLWKVDGPKGTVYLLGSVHVLKKQDYPLPAPMEKAFERSTVVYFETDIEAMNDPKLQLKLAAKGQLPAGKSLKTELSKETYSKLSRHLEEFGVPAGTFDTFQPWFTAVALVGLEFPKLGLDPEYGVDKHLHKRAAKAGKTIVPLETIDFQFDLFASLGKDEGEEFLLSTLDDIHSVRTMFDKLLASWRAGDTAGLEQILREAFDKHPGIAKRFLTDRNERWVKEFEKLLREDKTALVVVGAAHMVGRNSVIDLLEKKGFKVTQQ